MQQHPVPQQISSYQFHLVGDMTLKQFFEVAGGVVVAILIYASGLPGLFKWPLIAISVILGAALAFFPLEERPLEQWIIAFFRSIYSPTLFYWSQPATPVKYFADEAPNQIPALQTVAPSTPEPANNKQGFLSRLEEGEQALLARFSGLIPSAPTQAQPASMPEQQTSAPIQNTDVQTQPVAVPHVASTEVQAPVQPTTPQNTQTVPLNPTFAANTSNITTMTQTAQFSPEAAPPLPPTQANIIVGQVMDATGKIVEGAILEIKDVQGRPVRALRSNRVGHFMIVTPLANGTYELDIEKQDLQFDPVKFDTTGAIIPPIAITAKPQGATNA